MPNGLYIDASQLGKGVKGFERLIKEFPDMVSDVLKANALAIDEQAKRNAPANNGFLRQSIAPDLSRPLSKRITANAPYAAYAEFGTGRYAAQYVGSLPPDYKAFASQFQGGSGKRSIKGLMFLLMNWFKRKGITERQHQYFIAKKIFIDGTHPHPFMIPALIKQRPKIERDFKNLLKKLKIV